MFETGKKRWLSPTYSGNYKVIRNNLKCYFPSNIPTIWIFFIFYSLYLSAIGTVTKESPGKIWGQLLGFDPSNSLRLRNSTDELMFNLLTLIETCKIWYLNIFDLKNGNCLLFNKYITVALMIKCPLQNGKNVPNLGFLEVKWATWYTERRTITDTRVRNYDDDKNFIFPLFDMELSLRSTASFQLWYFPYAICLCEIYIGTWASIHDHSPPRHTPKAPFPKSSSLIIPFYSTVFKTFPNIYWTKQKLVRENTREALKEIVNFLIHKAVRSTGTYIYLFCFY